MKLLYVDTIQCDVVHIIWERPCIASWSMDILRRRESIEIPTGGFGIGNVAEPLVDAQREDRSRENEEIDIKCDTKMNMSVAKTCGTKQASTSDAWQGVMGGAQEIVETLTQFFSNPETIEGVDKTIKVYEKLQMSDFSFGLTQEFDDVSDLKENAPNRDDNDVVPNVKPISEIYTGPIGRRASKAGRKICSPYMNGQVDAHRPNKKVELILSNLIFAMEGSQMGVIDIWATMLNNNEQYRSKSSP
ncbi:hypothetical protein Ccrd_022387 [Cynara cardunculus var. scolymus]|uniref:Uncharacterized protein n=1 Tax=Cynara cardunculus var. scolymus TaxID=59895 RepID=A0A118JZ18_CYNCS|nr:hypothetical protein Ccrd_022387 [Cynara cardunculus var. scolymus]